MNLKTDSIFGISTEKAYKELLEKQSVAPIVVAIIDGGIDIDYEDLLGKIWINPKKIPEIERMMMKMDM